MNPFALLRSQMGRRAACVPGAGESPAFQTMKLEELAYHKTPLGELILRRREEPRLQNREIFEVKLGEEFLMSSLFTKAEEELANLGLADLTGELDVVVGGLGLGYTASAALENKSVKSLLVIDKFQEVINWHQQELVPLGKKLSNDERCELRQGDFFELAKTGFDASEIDRKFDAVLLDIDHSPKHYLDNKNESFYGVEGLNSLRSQLKNDGVFALWSDDPADETFRNHLEGIFGKATARIIEFPNPYTKSISINSIYIAYLKN